MKCQNHYFPACVRRSPPEGAVELSPVLLVILQHVRREVGYLGLGPETQAERLARAPGLIQQAAEEQGVLLSAWERDLVLAEIEREGRPFGVLEELVNDPDITDVIVKGHSSISFQQGRENFASDLRFPSQEAYEAFVERILLRAQSTYSTKKPIADGMIDGIARIHVVHRCLCAEEGPYLTIRLNRYASVTTKRLVDSGVAPSELFAYLEALVRNGQTLLIAGEVGTGKTTLARALAGTIPMTESILVIEDTPEIKLHHAHVRHVVTREANSDGAGRVTPSEVIRGGMRMAMNRIIFGEIRDAEAAEAFVDVCASGHPGLSTIHARNAAETIARLELFLGRAQKGVERSVLTQQVATAVGAIIFIGVFSHTGRRRIMEVRELGGVADGVVRQREIFRYEIRDDVPAWRVVNKVSAHREALESDINPVVLSRYPAMLELPFDNMYREAAMRRAG